MNENHSPRRMTSGFLRAGGAAAVITAVLLVLGVLGNVRIAGHVRASMEESMAQLESQFAEQEKQESQEESRHEETAVHEIQLTYMEEQLLNLVTERLEAKDFEGAARVLNNNENAFQELFFGKLADELCLYDGSVMKDEADGRGLVFLKATTVFYGDFQDGKPSGDCVALQALHLEEGVRYDYSDGTWKDGRMEGSGECGYDYYEGVTGDGAKRTVKQGSFSEDLMEGELTYTSINGEGEATTWTMMVDNGVIVPDERWISDTADDGTPVYRLMADTDAVHAYVVDEKAMEEVRWKNMIEWEK